MSISFSRELEGFKKALQEKRNTLEELKKQRSAHSVQTRKARAALEDLRAVLAGKTPPSERKKSNSPVGISALDINEDTDRPRRGARRQQVLEICRKVGRRGEIFRTRDVLNILRKVEGDEDGKLKKGIRSYTYSLMNTLRDEGFVQKKGRGKWVLTE